MTTAEVLLSTHIYIVMLLSTEYSIDGGCGRDPYGTGRESEMEVGIIGRVDLQMLMQYSPYRPISKCEEDSGVRLKCHPTMEPIEIESGYGPVLVALGTLLIDN